MDRLRRIITRPALWLILALFSSVVAYAVPAAIFRGAPTSAMTVLTLSGWSFVPVPFYIPFPALVIALLQARARRYAAAIVFSIISFIATVPVISTIKEPLPGIAWSYATPILVLIGAVVGLLGQAPPKVADETPEAKEPA